MGTKQNKINSTPPEAMFHVLHSWKPMLFHLLQLAAPSPLGYHSSTTLNISRYLFQSRAWAWKLSVYMLVFRKETKSSSYSKYTEYPLKQPNLSYVIFFSIMLFLHYAGVFNCWYWSCFFLKQQQRLCLKTLWIFIIALCNTFFLLTKILCCGLLIKSNKSQIPVTGYWRRITY